MNTELNEAQKNAVEAPPGPLLIVAGAGTGKTRTLTSRLVRFVEQGMRPEKICALTFTNKAAREMRERISNPKNPNSIRIYESEKQKDARGHSNAFIGSGHGSPFIGTFHALGARILRYEAKLLGRGQNFVIFDGHDSFDLIKKIVKKTADEEKNGKTAPSFFAEKISDIKNTADAFEKLKHSQNQQDVLALQIFEKYETELRRHNAFDFDDLIEKVVRMLRNYPEVLGRYQKKFDAVLVDEYQDLNPMQYEFVQLLAREHRNLSVVGDDEQMIYGWRYANLAIFFNFEKDWSGASVKFLEENYRSTANIIQAASAVTENNQYRRPKNLWTKNETGTLIKIYEAQDEEGEAEWIVDEISKLSAKGGSASGGKIPNSKDTVAILYRTNAQSRALEHALIEREIPYQIFGGLKFYERREIKDIVAAIRWAANPKDELSRERLLKALGKRRFEDIQAALEGLKNMAPTELIGAFLKAADYFDYLERNFTNYAERKENIAELLGFAARFEEPLPFLEEIALVQSTDVASSGTMTMTNDDDKTNGHSHRHGYNPVRLSTIHLAKGLEFDRVFIAGCSEGLLPHSMSMENDYELEEERRLLYVAMTRAKSELSLSFYDLPSRFLGEIPEPLTEFQILNSRGTENYDGERVIYTD